jgi:hypothetical protein
MLRLERCFLLAEIAFGCFADTDMSGDSDQGCQMVCFQTKNTNFGKIWRALE